MNYYTSDFHFSHFKIMAYENRPFSNTEEMNDYIIENLNKYIKPKDTLYHLGDFAFCRIEKIIEIRKKIKCKRIVLVPGNHDEFLRKIKRKEIAKEYFDIIDNVTVIRENGKKITLCHYPLETFPFQRYGGICLHGHCHGKLKTKIKNRIDVCIDTRKFDGSRLAYTLDEILEIQNARESKVLSFIRRLLS